MSVENQKLAERTGSSVDLLREILPRGRQALADLQGCFPQYKPDPELFDLHKRMEDAIRRVSPNAPASATPNPEASHGS